MKLTRRLAYSLLAAVGLAAVSLVAVTACLVQRPQILRQVEALAQREHYLGPNPQNIQQHHDYDCGPTALQIALLEFGQQASLADLGRDAGTSKAGTSMLGLQRACQAHGIAAEGWKLGYHSLLSSSTWPAIVQVDGDHFLVIRYVEAERVVANDPAIGTVAIVRSTFETRWSGFALLLRPKHPREGQPTSFGGCTGVGNAPSSRMTEIHMKGGENS